MTKLLYIAVAGALGSVCRYLIGLGLLRLAGSTLPYGTLAVNVLGSFLIGFLMEVFAARGALDTHLRVGLTVGFLGGFTTYSSFAFETVQLVEERQGGTAGLYVGATLVAAAAACAGGVALGRTLR